MWECKCWKPHSIAAKYKDYVTLIERFIIRNAKNQFLMGRKYLTLGIASLLAVTFFSCNKVTPASFWKNYNSRFLIKNVSDQGPYGGHLASYWKSNQDNTFISSGIIKFANENGWRLTDSLTYDEPQTTRWTYLGKSIFPLSEKGFSGVASNNSTYEYFPRSFGGKIKVYKFKTGWITIDPATDNSIEENGFVLLNNRGNEMSVYHLWGE